MDRPNREILMYGAVAGAAASVPQAIVGKLEDVLLLPPDEDANIAPRLVDRLGRAIGEHPSKAEEWALGTLFHVGYGAGWGAIYGLIAERLQVRPLVGGSVLGAVIYLITFPKWGAAVLTGTERPAGARTPRMTFVAGSVAMAFGIATGLIYDVLSRDSAADNSRKRVSEYRAAQRSASAASAAK